MKKSLKLFGMLLSLVAVTVFVGCGDDDPKIDDGGDGIAVADGYYFAKVDEDPVAIGQMKASTVDGPGFSAMTREGFFQAYVYLTAGSYNMVEVQDREILNTFGGPAQNVAGQNAECDESSTITTVGAAVDGPAFNIENDGLYVIAYDTEMGEIVYDEIETAGVIGAATPAGWGASTTFTESTITAEGATFTGTNIPLEEGEWKFRFNCRWAIDRRIDPNQDFANDNGYSFFTNFGGAVDNLQPGNEGANINNTVRGNYTVSISWDPSTGWSATTEKTGDLEPLPEYPEELWMVGATIGGWDWAANGLQMVPVHSNPHLFWRIAWLDADAADPGIKFAPQADWIGDFGVEGDATDGVYAKGTSNVPAPATSGYYIVVVNLEDGAETIEVNPAKVYGIGSIWEDDSWSASSETNLFTEDATAMTLASPAITADGELRMHTYASTFTPVADGPAVEWWQAEFIFLNGEIAYRGTGGDQERVNVTAGQVVTLDFKNGTGSVE